MLSVQPHHNGQFPETRWSRVARANSTDSAIAERALNEIYSDYHYPLYCFIRRREHSHHDAQDILHDFLAKLLESDPFSRTTPDKGRLRGYLCKALQNFLSNWNRDHRNEQNHVSADADDQLAKAEERYLREKLTDHDTPDRLFARKWAHELMNRVLIRLREGFRRKGRLDLFQALLPVLLNGGSLRDENSSAIANSLNMTGDALRKALERMLIDYRKYLTEEVALTVTEPSDIPAEIIELQSLFRERP